jgi:hypothetical protein
MAANVNPIKPMEPVIPIITDDLVNFGYIGHWVSQA